MKRSKQKMAASLRELGRAVGRAHQVIARWVERPDWPFSRRGPWNPTTVARIKSWAASTLAPNPAADAAEILELPAPSDRADERHAKLRLLKVRANKLEMELAILAGDYVPRKDVEIAFLRRVYAVKAAFEGLPRQMAGRLVGMTETEIEEALEQVIRQILLEMSQTPALPPLPNMDVNG